MKILILAFITILLIGLSPQLYGQVTAQGDTVTCFGSSDGSLIITATSGQSPFTYFWQRSTGSPNGGGALVISNTATLSNLPAGSYSITLVDANNITSNTTATITSPPLLTMSVTAQTNNLCAGAANGSFTVLGSGGFPPFEYSIDGTNYQTSGTFSNLSTQTYIVRVKDSQGCVKTINTTITEPTTAVGGFVQTQTNIACFGDSTGSFNIVGNGGISPYLYSLDGGTTQYITGVFNNLPAGNYTVQIEDDLGCTFDFLITLTQNSPLLSNAVILNNATSPQNPNGSAIVSATGGTSPYTFLWDNGQSTSIATGLSAGSHCVTTTDSKGCVNIACVTITSPPAIVLTATDNTLACFGQLGQSIITVSGGVAPYAYGWVNPATGTTGSGVILMNGGIDTIKNLPAGIYLIGITDVLNETKGDTFFIVQPLQLNLAITKNNVTCFGTNNGSATATVSGGIPLYDYVWSNSATTPTINSLASGWYYVTATDFNNCQVTDSTLIAAPAQQLTVLMSKTDITCNGASDGKAFTTVQGGIPPYTYIWSNGDATSSVLNLPPGVVAVSVTDAFGCSVTGSINITQPFTLTTANTPIGNASCFGGNNASAVTVPNGGTTPYNYLWDNGQTAAFADSLTAGSHIVTVTDARGCMVTAAVTVGQATQLTAIMSDTVVSCKGFNDGALVAFPSGGTGAYKYRWNSHPFADTLQVSADLFAGVYKVTITDANGCTLVKVDTVRQPTVITAISSTTMASCHDNFTNDGTATLIASGGNGGFSYLWNTNDTTTFVDSLVMGWYYVTVTDTVGCIYEDSVFVAAPPRIAIADTSITLVSCHGGSDGTATIIPMGGTPPYDYQWLTAPNQTAPTATGLPIGWYSVVVNDGNNCYLDTTRIYVRQPFRPLAANISSEPPRCKDGADGRLSVSPAYGGTAGYTYAWSTGDSTFNVFGVSPGNYNLTITDSKGCILIKDTTVTNPERFYYNITTIPVTCFDGYDGQIIVDTAFGGGGAPFAYGFNYGLFQSNNRFINLPPTQMAVSVRDGKGCEQDTIVTVANAIELFVSLGSDKQVYLGDSIALEALVNTSNPLSYTWTPILDLTCPTCATTMVVPTQDEIIYTVMVVDSNGCMATDELMITVIQQRKAYIPNAFTPNGDGINDIFVPFGGEGVTGVAIFQIYTRWGELVHSVTNFMAGDAAFGWDGFLIGNETASSGVYVYYIEYEFIDGKKIPYTGDITLLR